MITVLLAEVNLLSVRPVPYNQKKKCPNFGLMDTGLISVTSLLSVRM